MRGFTGEANVDETNVKKPGTAIVWKLGLPVSEVFSVIQNRGQSIKVGDRRYLNIYAPSGGGLKKQERREFFGGDVFRQVRSLGNTIPVLVGDFNSVISPLDCEDRFVDKKSPALLGLVNGFNYVDAFRYLHPREREYTFFRPSCTPSRLDRVYIHRGSGQDVLSVAHGPSIADHRYVVVVLDQRLHGVVGGDGGENSGGVRSLYWKLNNSILKSEDFFALF